jgi:hypothetical protein
MKAKVIPKLITGGLVFGNDEIGRTATNPPTVVANNFSISETFLRSRCSSTNRSARSLRYMHGFLVLSLEPYSTIEEII